MRHVFKALSLLVFITITQSGCATSTVLKVDPCAGWSAIYPSKQDVLTDGTAKQILAHDLHGVAQGCWGAPKRRAASQ
jgi:hypothetical protein